MTINSVVKKMIRISVNGYHKPLPSSFKTSVGYSEVIKKISSNFLKSAQERQSS